MTIKPYKFHFITKWTISGSHHDGAAKLIIDYQHWKKWIKAIRKIETLDELDKIAKIDLGIYPYTFVFDGKFRESSKGIELHAIGGDLRGNGLFQINQIEDKTYIKFTWDVISTKKWINLTAPMFHILFEKAHEISMRWMALGMAKELNCALENFDETYGSSN